MGIHVYVCVCVWVAQLCPTLCNPMDSCLPGSSVHGILQARILEWVVVPFSRGSSNPGIEPRSSALQVDSLSAELPGKPKGQAGWHQIPHPQGMNPLPGSFYSFTRKVTSLLGKPDRWIFFSTLALRVRVGNGVKPLLPFWLAITWAWKWECRLAKQT